MSRVCDICGKGPVAGRQITHRGLSKRKGGIGLNVTGVSRRRFLPNIQTVRCRRNGTVRRLRVCTRCLKAGKVVKA